MTGLRCTSISAVAHGLQHPDRQPTVLHIQTTCTQVTPPILHLSNYTSPAFEVVDIVFFFIFVVLHDVNCKKRKKTTCPGYIFHTAFIQASLNFHHLQTTQCENTQRGVHVGRGRERISTLLIFSFGCVSSAGKWFRASQLSTTWVCSSVPVTMFPTALRAAVCTQRGRLGKKTVFLSTKSKTSSILRLSLYLDKCFFLPEL